MGLAFRAGSGQPLTALAANPVYDEPYEIPETLRGAGFQTTDGFRSRAQAEVLLDLHLDYTIRFGKGAGWCSSPTSSTCSTIVIPSATTREPRSPSACRTRTSARPNPADPTNPFGPPRQVRLGARLEW